MKITKNQLRTMVKESVARNTAGKKTMKITVSELNERVREIVKNKLEELRAPALVPSKEQISEALGYGTGTKVGVPAKLELNERELLVLSYASLLSGKGGKTDSPAALQESVEALRAVKTVSSLVEEDLEKVHAPLVEWASKNDDSITDAAKILVEKLLNEGIDQSFDVFYTDANGKQGRTGMRVPMTPQGTADEKTISSAAVQAVARFAPNWTSIDKIQDDYQRDRLSQPIKRQG